MEPEPEPEGPDEEQSGSDLAHTAPPGDDWQDREFVLLKKPTIKKFKRELAKLRGKGETFP
jgi:hypothetical protein